MFDWLFITRTRAKKAGLTHEGTLFGVPTWFAADADGIRRVIPKVPALSLWGRLTDWYFRQAAHSALAAILLASPIRVTGRI